MGRSRATAKKAGTEHERRIADYFAAKIDDRIDRRVKTGGHDKGDIGGLRTEAGAKIVIECKDYGGQVKVSEWLREAEVETANDGALAGVVIAKRRGTTDPGKQIVLMTVDNLIAILTSKRAGERDGQEVSAGEEVSAGV